MSFFLRLIRLIGFFLEISCLTQSISTKMRGAQLDLITILIPRFQHSTFIFNVFFFHCPLNLFFLDISCLTESLATKMRGAQQGLATILITIFQHSTFILYVFFLQSRLIRFSSISHRCHNR